MSAGRAIFLKECVELLPPTLIASAAAAVTGVQNWNPYGVDSVAPFMLMIAAALGASHGALDRRRAGSPFDRHRPVRSRVARWAAGFVAVLLVFTALQVGRLFGRWTAEPRDVVQVLNQLGSRDGDPWALPGALWVFAACPLAWSCLRAAVGWRGVAAPIALVALLPLTTAAAVVAADPASLPIVGLLTVLYSVLPMRNAARRVCLLAVALVLGHGLLVSGRVALLAGVESSYGEIGIDQQGRVRHWRWVSDGEHVEFLSADEVASGQRTSAESWRTRDLMAEFLVHLPGATLVAPGSDMAVALHDVSGDYGRYWTSDRLGDGRTTGHGWRDESEHRYSTLLHVRGENAVESLLIRSDGAALVRVTVPLATRVGSKIETHELPLDPAVADTKIQQHGEDDGDFVGVVGDEYWIVGLDGNVEQRQPLSAPYREISFLYTHAATRGYLAPGARPRPDRIPLRMIVARRGEELITRDAVLEPATPFQRAVSIGFGALASLRPLALNLAASLDAGAPKLVDMRRRWWLDPFFSAGANRSWLVATLLVTLVSAFVAWRWARVRIPGDHWLWVGAVLLLGPTGLVWMRLALPGVAIEDGRAVNIELPAWPEPVPSFTA